MEAIRRLPMRRDLPFPRTRMTARLAAWRERRSLKSRTEPPTRICSAKNISIRIITWTARNRPTTIRSTSATTGTSPVGAPPARNKTPRAWTTIIVSAAAHFSGFMMAFCDGSVHSISYAISAAVNQQLCCRNDGQLLTAPPCIGRHAAAAICVRATSRPIRRRSVAMTSPARRRSASEFLSVRHRGPTVARPATLSCARPLASRRSPD